jgi:hypothetical protein
MLVSLSRFTPGAKGNDICFEKGETVKYKLANGNVIDITIDSELMKHDECKTHGYESIFSDDGKRYFADSERIVGWEGKMESIEELNNKMDEIKKQNPKIYEV